MLRNHLVFFYGGIIIIILAALIAFAQYINDMQKDGSETETPEPPPTPTETPVPTLIPTPTETPTPPKVRCQLAFVSRPGGYPQINLMDLRFQDDVEIVSTSPVDIGAVPGTPTDIGYLAWSPEGDQLAFTMRLEDRYDIYIYDFNTLDVPAKNVTLDSDNNNRHPAWMSQNALVIANSDSLDRYSISGMDIITGHPSPVLADPTNSRQPAYSTERGQIAFVVEDEASSGRFRIYLADANGGNRHPLIQSTDPQRSDTSPAWSSDGQWIAYTSVRGGDPDIYIANASTGIDARQLTDTPWVDYHPAWSPDDSWIAYSNEYDIYIISLNSGDAVQLTEDQKQNEFPAWRPDPACRGLGP